MEVNTYTLTLNKNIIVMYNYFLTIFNYKKAP